MYQPKENNDIRSLSFGLLSFLVVRIRLISVSLSLLLSLWRVYTAETINNDGILYINTAKRLLAGDWLGAYELYDWFYYPSLIALVSLILGIELEISAQIINALLTALMVFAFITLVREIDSDLKILIIAGLVILLHPYINDNRAEIVRDHGYWACYLLALSFFLKYYKFPQWRYALAWGFAILNATLFRVEGVVFFVVTPIILLFHLKGNFRFRLQSILRLYIIFSLFFLVLFAVFSINGFDIKTASVNHNPFDLLFRFIYEIRNGLYAKGEVISKTVLSQYADDYALTAVVVTLLVLLLDKVFTALTPLYGLLIAALYNRVYLNHDLNLIMIEFCFINISIVSVFLFANGFISGRHVMPLALTILVFIPPILKNLIDQWALNRKVFLWRNWVYFSIFFIFVYQTGDGLLSLGGTSKDYVKQAGLWLEEQVTMPVNLYTNNQKIAYYSGQSMSYDGYVDWRHLPQWQLNIQTLRNLSWQQYDYLALWVTRDNFKERQQFSNHLGVEPIKVFENRKKDAVLIYKIPGFSNFSNP